VTDSPAFRRAIWVRGAGGRVEADLEDDFHSFGVTLHHDGQVVRRVEARATRYPWATCLAAQGALAALAGATLRANPATLFQHADPRAHCTHLFELAALALAQAARGDGERLFEAEVSDPDGEACLARLFRDGSLALAWRLAGDVIEAPSLYAGEPLASFSSKRLANLDPEQAEALLILRRVTQTARGRQMDVDAFATAAAMGRPAQCYSLQPPNAVRALRVAGSIRDWPNRGALRRSVQRHPG
jgi:hypothetical protein